MGRDTRGRTGTRGTGTHGAMSVEIYPDHSVIFDCMYHGRISKISATEPPRFSRWLGGGIPCGGALWGGTWGDPIEISAPSHTAGGQINPEFELEIRAACAGEAGT